MAQASITRNDLEQLESQIIRRFRTLSELNAFHLLLGTVIDLAGSRDNLDSFRTLLETENQASDNDVGNVRFAILDDNNFPSVSAFHEKLVDWDFLVQSAGGQERWYEKLKKLNGWVGLRQAMAG